jgi:hypothetical protein
MIPAAEKVKIARRLDGFVESSTKERNARVAHKRVSEYPLASTPCRING